MTDFDQDGNSVRGDLADRVIRRDIRPRWVAEVNQAMDRPLPEARQILDNIIAERRQRAAELRATAARSGADDRHRVAYLGAAEWVDSGVLFAEQLAQRLAELDASGQVETDREQIARELTGGHANDCTESSRGWSL